MIVTPETATALATYPASCALVLGAGGWLWWSAGREAERLIPLRTGPIQYSAGYSRPDPADRIPLEYCAPRNIRPYMLIHNANPL